MLSHLARATMAATWWSLGSGRLRLLAGPPVRLARRALVALGDPVVESRVGELEIRLPISHDLPIIRRAHPLYDTALSRLAEDYSGRCADPCLFHRDDRVLGEEFRARERVAARLDLPRIGDAG